MKKDLIIEIDYKLREWYLKKIDTDLVRQFKEGLEDLKSERVRRVA